MEYQKNTLEIETYRSLRQSVGWQNFDRRQAEQALKRSAYSVLAMENGSAVGMGRLLGDGVYYLIADVVVRPEYQGRGVGRAIMKELLAYAERGTPPGGRVSVQLIAAAGKEPFYQRLGFRTLPSETAGAGMQQVIYQAPE